jgi:hypothetical protein
LVWRGETLRRLALVIRVTVTVRDVLRTRYNPPQMESEEELAALGNESAVLCGLTRKQAWATDLELPSPTLGPSLVCGKYPFKGRLARIGND